MEIIDERENTSKNVAFAGTVAELLATLKINPETVLVVRENEVLTEDDALAQEDKITLLSVISGG